MRDGAITGLLIPKYHRSIPACIAPMAAGPMEGNYTKFIERLGSPGWPGPRGRISARGMINILRDEAALSLICVAEPRSRTPVMAANPTVFVVDDDISVRESLELLIRDQGWEPILFESAREFMARKSMPVPSCVVLDVNLPDLSGLDLQQQISGANSISPIIFITGYADIPMSVRAMKAGAIEFLTKPFDQNTIVDAIRSALHRSQSVLAKEAERAVLRERFASLSKREREVMVLVVRGLMNKQVAGELGISEITIKAHRGRVMRNMQATTFASLVNMATELGMATGSKM
jgi:FixJ family two-component response regulator